MNCSTAPRSQQEGMGLWLYKIIAGLFIVLLITIHMIVNHLVVPGGLLTYQDVVRYYAVPFIPVMEITFLIVVVSHALIGLRSIILDLNPSPKVLKFITWILVGLGSFAVIYGTWLVIVIAGRGAAL